MRVLAVEHAKIAPPAAEFLAQALDRLNHVTGLCFPTGKGNRFHRPRGRESYVSGVSHRLQRRALVGDSVRMSAGKRRWIFLYQREGSTKNGASGSTVGPENDALCRGKLTIEKIESRTGRAAETVDGLIRVADCKDVALLACQAREQLDLGKVHVLEFVDENEFCTRRRLSEHRRIVLQQGMRPRDHVAERAQIFFPQPAFGAGKNAGDFAATPKDFLVANVASRLGHTWNRELPAFELAHILRITFGRDQLVVAAAHELQQIFQKLAYIGGAHEMFEMQVAQPPPQIDPEIGVIENAEVLVHPLQQIEAVIVKRGGVHAGCANKSTNSLFHLGGGIFRVRERQNFFRLGMTFLD